MRVAVTGGSGYVGGFIVDHLLKAGHEVRLMVRPDSTRPMRDLDNFAVELDPDSDFRGLLNGCGALVHAAFHHQRGQYRHGEGQDLQGFLRKNVSGSLALLNQAFACGVGRAIILSSRAVYGRQIPGAILSEDMAGNPDTHYGAAKAALEAFAASYALQDGWPVCALRPTGVYGLVDPVDRSKWYDLVGACLAGQPLPVRGGTEVHGADIADAVLRLLRAEETEIAGNAFNCSDMYLSTRDIAAIVQDRSGRDIALPAQPADQAAYNVMDCSRLTRLGIAFSGRARFEQTVAALTAHHLENGA